MEAPDAGRRGGGVRTFLFGSDRASLARFRPVLEEAQEGRCLLCRDGVGSQVALDHFIPWRRYPTDLGHNLVLAHDHCNARKGDRLAAERHLGRWQERNAGRDDVLSDGFDQVGAPHDLEASRRIAVWAYRQVEMAEGQVWVEADVLEPLGVGWEGVLR